MRRMRTTVASPTVAAPAAEPESGEEMFAGRGARFKAGLKKFGAIMNKPRRAYGKVAAKRKASY